MVLDRARWHAQGEALRRPTHIATAPNINGYSLQHTHMAAASETLWLQATHHAVGRAFAPLLLSAREDAAAAPAAAATASTSNWWWALGRARSTSTPPHPLRNLTVHLTSDLPTATFRGVLTVARHAWAATTAAPQAQWSARVAAPPQASATVWSAALDSLAPAAERAACFLRLSFAPDDDGGGGGGAPPPLVAHCLSQPQPEPSPQPHLHPH